MFWACTALTISGTVIANLASWSGLTHSRIAYWPAPNTCTWPIPGERVTESTRLIYA